MGDLLTKPPSDATLFDADGVPVTRTPDGELLAWTPEPRSFPRDSFLRNAGEVDRTTWDELRAAWA